LNNINILERSLLFESMWDKTPHEESDFPSQSTTSSLRCLVTWWMAFLTKNHWLVSSLQYQYPI
jgi:hypothetical protein